MKNFHILVMEEGTDLKFWIYSHNAPLYELSSTNNKNSRALMGLADLSIFIRPVKGGKETYSALSLKTGEVKSALFLKAGGAGCVGGHILRCS